MESTTFEESIKNLNHEEIKKLIEKNQRIINDTTECNKDLTGGNIEFLDSIYNGLKKEFDLLSTTPSIDNIFKAYKKNELLKYKAMLHNAVITKYNDSNVL